jgi:hypothetical protein
VDFDKRPHAFGTEWPISFEDVGRWYSQAASYFGLSSDGFSYPIKGSADRDISIDSVEKWTPEINMSRLYRRSLRESKKITVLLGATVTDLEYDPTNEKIVTVTIAAPKQSRAIAVSRCIIACGGLESTRLLMVLQKKYPTIFPSSDRVLGKYYMGHISGKICDLILADPSRIEDFEFFLDGRNYCRRRLNINAGALRDEFLLNAAFWPENPPFFDASHRSGILSLVWLTLKIPFLGRRLAPEGVRINHVGPPPFQYARHFMNVIGSPKSTFVAILQIIQKMFFHRPRMPSFLIRSETGRYSLHYHAEHLPNYNSKISLSAEKDSLGVPRLVIDFKYSHHDARSVLNAHRLLDRALRRSGLGRLEYKVEERHLEDYILKQASDGFHQIGTTRMSDDPTKGIVDPNCKVYGIQNLFLAGSSIFPSSSQANPTFVAVALGLRLISHLANRAKI